MKVTEKLPRNLHFLHIFYSLNYSRPSVHSPRPSAGVKISEFFVLTVVCGFQVQNQRELTDIFLSERKTWKVWPRPFSLDHYKH